MLNRVFVRRGLKTSNYEIALKIVADHQVRTCQNLYLHRSMRRVRTAIELALPLRLDLSRSVALDSR